MKYCKHCGNPMGDSDKKCSVCGADSAGRIGKRASGGSSGTSKILLAVTVISVAVALAVILIFAVLPSINKKPQEEGTPIDEPSVPDISVYAEAAENYELFLNGKLEDGLSKLMPKTLSDYLCSLYEFNEAEVLEAGYEKTASLPCRVNLESYRDSDIYVSVEVTDAKECGDDVKNALKERLSQNFRTDIGDISEVSLLSVRFSYSANGGGDIPGVFSLTGFGTTEPMYGIKYGETWYLADANGDMAFDEWDIHSYYSEYYMHN